MDLPPPNIVFIIADDLGYGDLACFGNDAISTPNIDRLAKGGMSLMQHYSASPLCAPARAALLTGRYSHRTGAVDVPSNRGLDRIALDEKLMPEYFRAAGYATGMIGKWHNGLHDMRYHPAHRGFDEFFGFLNGGMDYYEWALDWNGETKYSDGRYLTDVFSKKAVDFIDRHNKQPFFLYLAYNAPHVPLQAPEPLIQKYRDMGRFNEEVCTVYAMIEQMDRGIGTVFQTLEKHDLTENTIIVFTSDNGPLLADWAGGHRFNGPFSGYKGQVLEGGIRVPAVVSYPGHVPSGTRTDSIVHFCDWLPTLLAWSGVTPGGGKPLDGFNRSDVLEGKGDGIEEVRFWQRNRYEPADRCNAAMIAGDWKLVMPMRDNADVKHKSDQGFYDHGLKAPHWLMDVNPDLPEFAIGPEQPPRLYNLAEDPAEQNDLSAQYPEKLKVMLAAWDEWFAEMKNEWRDAYEKNRKKNGLSPYGSALGKGVL